MMITRLSIWSAAIHITTSNTAVLAFNSATFNTKTPSLSVSTKSASNNINRVPFLSSSKTTIFASTLEDTEIESDKALTTDTDKLLSSQPPIPPPSSSKQNGGTGTAAGATTELENLSMNDNNNDNENSSNSKLSWTERITNSGAVSAAAIATAAVNSAVAMKTLEAPEVSKSFIALDTSTDVEDGSGLPLTYDRELISQYWKKERGALNQRWSYFVGKAVPFLTRLVTLFITEGEINERHIPGLSRQARMDIQDLGPTFIKAGQMMSVRPDVLPQATLDELAILQDSVVAFETSVAVSQIEKELGGPLNEFFTSISEEPVAAASLAQVYLATLADGNNTRVAVKVQRPDVLQTVSKDLYVLRRAAEVFQGLVERFAPQQNTNYVALLNEWAIGFYTELDFKNEAQNQERLRDVLIDNGLIGVTVPKVFNELCTRRILVSEWVDGKKLSEATTEEIKEVTPLAQEAFLIQLFDAGFFHADPHPGNLLLLDEPTEEGHKVALIDCGLMANIDQADRDKMISAVIHLANKDYTSLVTDFMDLGILPDDCDKPTIIPLMDKALSPYVQGGGAKKYEEELKRMYGMDADAKLSSQVGGFQAMTQDALTVLNDVPFAIPPYFAILGRAIVTLEGVALTGDEEYGIIMESYPFIARKLLREDRPEIQRALVEVLFNDNSSSSEGESGGLKFTRLLAILNNAAGSVGKQNGGVFVDLDAIPDDGLSFSEGLRFLLSDQAESLRSLLESEIDNIIDIVLRQILRKGASEVVVALTPPRPPSIPFFGDIFGSLASTITGSATPPKLDEVPLPFLLPGKDGEVTSPSVAMMTVQEFIDALGPKLSREDEVYAIGLSDVAEDFFGPELAEFLRGNSVLSAQTAQIIVTSLKNGAFLGGERQREILQSDLTKQFLDLTTTVLDNNANVHEGEGLKNVLTVVNELNDDEKKLFANVTDEMIQRALTRAVDRLSSVQRLF